jgi:hypothetical protein
VTAFPYSARKVTDDMARPTTRTPVAIFNSRAEFIDGLCEALEREGVPTATALLAEIQDGTLDLVAFLEVHDPRVIVYDLPCPFERHWNFLRLLRQADPVFLREHRGAVCSQCIATALALPPRQVAITTLGLDNRGGFVMEPDERCSRSRCVVPSSGLCSSMLRPHPERVC